LRFYLPHIVPFKDLSEVIFMDDDVIIQGDIAKAWDYELHGDAVMSASCHNWVWSDCDRFESSTSLSYLDVPYLGFGRLGASRSAAAATCTTDYERECIPSGFLEVLAKESLHINGHRNAATLENLNRTNAWNYGFNKFDLEKMRKHKITEKYDKWIA
jgi:lipopolysaccharide biosynthesis glycosyltransferase